MKEHVMKHVYLTIAITLLAASGAQAQTSPDLSGHWKGTIEIPNSPADFELDIARNARGELYGTATSGADKVTIPLQKISLEGRRLTFYARTDQPMQAEISESGKIASGTATLAGYALPFSMGRTGEAKIGPQPTSPAVSKQLEGVWKGAVSAGGAQYHFVVTVENQPGGRATATSVSVDEGGLTLPLTVSQDGSNVTFESHDVPITFAGTLNAAGTELAGTFTQETTSLPLTFTR
jgi:hypothetical protein